MFHQSLETINPSIFHDYPVMKPTSLKLLSLLWLRLLLLLFVYGTPL